MVDNADELILSALSKNSRQDINEIWDFLRDHGYDLTEEEIESKIIKLEEDHVITGYTVSVDTRKLRRRTIRVALVTFKMSQHLPRRLEGWKKYLVDAPFVLFSGRTRGGYDWICVQSFLNEEMADEETDIFRNLFGDIIQSYEVYDFMPMKNPAFHVLTHTRRIQGICQRMDSAILGKIIIEKPSVVDRFHSCIFETYRFINQIMNLQSGSHKKIDYFCSLTGFNGHVNLIYQVIEPSKCDS
jgi:DNA-binding Lrp family transcriptional regulator